MPTTRKITKYIADAVFTAFILWTLYVYYLYRFQAVITFDTHRLDMDSSTGKLIKMVAGLIVAYVTNECGQAMGNIVKDTIALGANIWRVRFTRRPANAVQAAMEAPLRATR